MKVAILGDEKRYARFLPNGGIQDSAEVIYLPRDAENALVLEKAGDADVLLADAISKVDAALISAMPNLKMIHSEGVAYNGIDVAAASARDIPVCNNKGGNAGAVAEQAIYLMLALLRTGVEGHHAVIAGEQIRMKERRMREGITDLGDCKVGLIGMGDIGQATAGRLAAFGCDLYYCSRNRRSPELEKELHLTWMPMDRLVEICDIISLHVAVTPETTGMVNEKFLSHMKKNAYLINTSRGELVDNQALRAALLHHLIAGAGLDTIAPEPVQADNPLVDLPESCRNMVIYSPHLGGITTGSFRRMHQNMWENVARIARGEAPKNRVN